ncbi:MAG: hypothetical protein O3A13_02145 [Proteobacteria bacterium]|nr:hypothetical protein [Pseudomonadota bacterium]MDA0992417.1 hypothetical protein [Pseudomonadota bacterium]
MFDFAGRPVEGRRSAAVRNFDALEAELENLGFMPPPRYTASRNSVCGIAQRVSVREVVEESAAGRMFLRQLCQLLDRGIPVTLSPEDFCSNHSVINSWQRFCEVIHRALSNYRLPGRRLGLCIHSHQMPLEAYVLISDVVIGRGPRYVFLDGLQMAARGNRARERAEANWLFLWRQRATERPVVPVYGGIVRSACQLLADEVAATVFPDLGLHAPVNSAWLPITLPLTGFATPEGQIRWQQLGNAIRASLVIADEIHDLICWHDPRQLADARENRRLAISVTGIGDLVVQSGADPGSLSCLRWLIDLFTKIRSEFHEQSGRLAIETGALPALAEANYVREWSAGPHRELWHQYWQDAVQRSAVRHRNLMVLSPYAVLPTKAPVNPSFVDLLPVIALADAWAFAAPPDFAGWSAEQYRHFHRRARATIQGSHTASFVAAGV